MINTSIRPSNSIPPLTLFPVKSKIPFLPIFACFKLHGDRSCQQIRPYLFKVTLNLFLLSWNNLKLCFVSVHQAHMLSSSSEAYLWPFSLLSPNSKPLLDILLQMLYDQKICFSHIYVCECVCH